MEPITSQSITLVIKTPNQRVRDIEVSCLLDWTVEKLKSHLANVYPTKPARSSQKIIYSGKLLDDHFVLKDILLENEGQQQTVHLVCTPSASDVSQSLSSLSAQDPPKTQAPVPEVPSLSSSTTTAAASTTTASTTQPDGLRHRTQQAFPQHPYYNIYHANLHTFPAQAYHGQVNQDANATTFIPGQPYLLPNAPHFSHYAAQHAAHMQWMHHMAQMMQRMPYTPMQPPIPQPQQAVNQQTPPANTPTPQAPQAQERQPDNRPQNRNLVMNANAGGAMMQEDDEDQENIRRDWLDHIYMGVRIVMLLSIFWFYSSAERLILMAVAMCVVWLLQSGWLNLNRIPANRRQGIQANAAENQEEGHEEREDDVDDEEDEEDGNETDSQSDETDANTTSDSNNDRSGRPEHPGYLAVCYNFVTTFFTSLIPQGPQPIAQP